MVFEPGGYIHQQSKTGGVGFRKTVLAEAQDLPVDLARERLLVAPFQHAVHQSLLELLQGAAAAPVHQNKSS